MNRLSCNSSDRSKATPRSKENTASAYHHGDLRKTLIAASLELVAEGENWNFSLREVARRAGVSHNAPYSHFAHKRDLLAAAAGAGRDLLRGQLMTAMAGIADPLAALRRLGAAWINFGAKNPALYRLMFSAAHSGPDWRPEQVLAAGVATRALLEDIFRRGARSGVFPPRLARESELQNAALCTWATVHGLTMLAIDGLANVGDISSEGFGQKIVAIITRGLGPNEASAAEINRVKAKTRAVKAGR
ncbi:MAG TPA: TetR/AcrR family transcriptional regulator [Acidobacteriaceae bacterium]|jgi:AcrR family transcriptional regulator